MAAGPPEGAAPVGRADAPVGRADAPVEVRMATKRSTVLRRLFQGPDSFICIGTSLAIHAKMAERVGFQAVFISGANTSTHILGMPDSGFITMSELVQNTRYVCDATTLPVLVDCDTGFGNAINVRRTVHDVIKAGAAGLFIEDQVSPKRCGFVKGKEVLPLDEAVGKYRAAIDARDELDPDFVIMARSDARGAVGGSLAECVERLRAYKQAGVDVLYAEALQSMDEIRAVRAQIEGPFFVTTAAIRPQPTLKELQAAGVSMGVIFLPHVGLTAMWDMLEDVRARGLEAWNEYVERTRDHALGSFRVFDLTGFPTVREWEEKYLSPEKLARYEQSVGAYEPGKPGASSAASGAGSTAGSGG
jgi:2-methylisocitrate lyase-like PEP mutase family enzyme